MPNLDYILGIESSCDETGVAVYHAKKGLVSDVLYSQVDTHAAYGGVVPELAARDHSNRIMPLVNQALSRACIGLDNLSGVAYCQGPGLASALLVGATVGRTLSWALGIPALGIHHLEGHILSVMLNNDTRLSFPFVSLLVSGGHTLLVRVNQLGQYEILGESLDDAVGEAFDKTAKLLGLAYPGGPALAKLAEMGNPSVFQFPRPLCQQAGLDFSFSGLKTHVSRCWEGIGKKDKQKANIARAFEEAVIDVLTIKCERALEESGLKELIVAGGVSANQRLRATLNDKLKPLGVTVHYPPLQFCTDNGAMIAYAGYLRLQQGEQDNLEIDVRPRWSLSDRALRHFNIVL